MSVADNLRRARALIDTPGKWCQRAMALRPADDFAPVDDEAQEAAAEFSSLWRDCLPEEAGACRFCVLGALAAADLVFWFDGDDIDEGLAAAEWRFLRAALPSSKMSLEGFNDAYGHADVLALFDRAIVLAEAP